MKRFFGTTFSVACIISSWLYIQPVTRGPTILRIYNWSHYIPSSVIQKFEDTYGVKVAYDSFDTQETLEARLLAARSGYDVVFPPALPTVKVFAPAGAFSKLNFKWLPNTKYLDPKILAQLRLADPEGLYTVPYLWGTTGLIYHKAKMREIAPDAPTDSWRLLFSKRWLQKLSPYRVVLLNSPADLFSDLFFSLGKNPFAFKIDQLEEAAHHLADIRDYVYKFDSGQIIQDLLAQRIIAAEIFSTYAHMAIATLKRQTGSKVYRYVIPKEGALMWIDTMAIPKDAPQKRLAHTFINFLMRPDIIAEITNQTYAANAVQTSRPFIKNWIRKSHTIYPRPSVYKRLYLERIPPRAYERLRIRYWTIVRAGYKPRI